MTTQGNRLSFRDQEGRRGSEEEVPGPRPREMRAFFSCMAWRGIPNPLSKLHRRLDSL